MKFFLNAFLALLAVTVIEAKAQQWPFELWHEGKLVTLKGDTLKGLIKYDLQQDLIQYIYKDRTVEVYSARKTLFFEIFDNTIHQYRQFYALPFTTQSGYKAPVFYELMVEGKLTLLAREFIEYGSYNSMYYAGAYSRQVLVYKYYFLKENGDIEEFMGNKNDLLDMMGKHDNEVDKYIRKNRLKYEEKEDMARIIAYYNSLISK